MFAPINRVWNVKFTAQYKSTNKLFLLIIYYTLLTRCWSVIDAPADISPFFKLLNVQETELQASSLKLTNPVKCTSHTIKISTGIKLPLSLFRL